MRKFRFAGVSKVDGQLRLRASNRDAYPEILARNKNTNVNIVKLDKPMTKDQIREHLARLKAFKSPAILSVLRRGEAVAPKRKAAKAKSAKRTAAKKAPEAASSAAA